MTGWNNIESYGLVNGVGRKKHYSQKLLVGLICCKKLKSSTGYYNMGTKLNWRENEYLVKIMNMLLLAYNYLIIILDMDAN